MSYCIHVDNCGI